VEQPSHRHICVQRHPRVSPMDIYTIYTHHTYSRLSHLQTKTTQNTNPLKSCLPSFYHILSVLIHARARNSLNHHHMHLKTYTVTVLNDSINLIPRTRQCVEGLKQAPRNFGECITFDFSLWRVLEKKVKSLSQIFLYLQTVD
jgi:hypothetical protein